MIYGLMIGIVVGMVVEALAQRRAMDRHEKAIHRALYPDNKPADVFDAAPDGRTIR